jgi:ribose transport system permease protein
MIKSTNSPTVRESDSSPRSPIISRLTSFLPYFGIALILLSTGIFALMSPYFFTPDNLLNILKQGSVVAIASFGLIYVIIVGGDDVVRGGIDLSIGATIGLVGSTTALVISLGQNVVIAICAGLVAALLVGLLNSVGVSVVGIRPLLVTLAIQGIATSADLVISNNSQIRVDHEFFVWLRDGSILSMPVSVVVLAISFASMWIVMSKTFIGVRSYAVGGNDVAAKVSGLNIKRYLFSSYLVASVFAWVAGILTMARLSGSTPGVGAILLLDFLLAGFMSVIFSRRLVPNLPGALASALFISILNNGFILINIPTYWVSGIKGALILLVVSVSALRTRRS